MAPCRSHGSDLLRDPGQPTGIRPPWHAAIVEGASTTFDAPASTERHPPGAAARVAVVEGQRPQVVELSRDRDASVGRSRSCDVVIEDRAASRLHATLQWSGGRTVRLTDHGSRNGTLVDGRPVTGSVELVSGSQLTIGSVVLVVSVPPTAAPSELPRSVVDDGIVASDPVMVAVIEIADRAARSDVTVLLDGETGAGKELVASRIHRQSRRAGGPFIAVNCGSIPDTLAESTLFGHEKGAFTGASSQRRGLFEAANGGTLFLDEVGELSPGVQARLLRVLEERILVRVGATEPLPVDVRVITATNRDLSAMVRGGAFRQDLLYRIDVLRITLPPLRSRPDDIEPLAARFLGELARGRDVRFSPDVVEALRRHAWPGNVRELRNVIERALTMAVGDTIQLDDLFGQATPDRGGQLRSRVHDVERDAIVEALEHCGGNQTRAAQRLGVSRRALIYKMERLGLKERPPSRG